MKDHYMLYSINPETPTDESIVPMFCFFLSFWAISYILCFKYKGGKEGFVEYIPLHVFHSSATVVFSSASLYFRDDRIFPERLMNIFSMSYFIVDIVDCIIRKDSAFFVHAILGLSTLVGCYTSVIHQTLRSASKGMMIEISTPALYLWKKTHKFSHALLFTTLFIACRIIWLPIYLHMLYTNETIVTDFVIVSSFLLFPLQLVWVSRLSL